jgi:hypothetical protein
MAGDEGEVRQLCKDRAGLVGSSENEMLGVTDDTCHAHQSLSLVSAYLLPMPFRVPPRSANLRADC